METGIFIRVKVNGKWDSVDIADERIPTNDILTWLRSRGGCNPWAENTLLIILGREPIARP